MKMSREQTKNTEKTSLAEIGLQAQAEHEANPDHEWNNWYLAMLKRQRQGYADYS